MHIDLPMFYGLVFALLSIVSLGAAVAAFYDARSTYDNTSGCLGFVGLLFFFLFGIFAIIAIFAERPNG